MSEPAPTSQDSAGAPTRGSASSRLFDLRDLIAGIFAVFGVALIVAGALDGPAELAKASGVRINLWTGIGMVALSAVFVAWRLWRPLRREDVPPAADRDAAGDQGPPAPGR